MLQTDNVAKSIFSPSSSSCHQQTSKTSTTTPKLTRKNAINLDVFQRQQAVDGLLKKVQGTQELLKLWAGYKDVWKAEQYLIAFQLLGKDKNVKPEALQPLVLHAVKHIETNEFQPDQVNQLIALLSEMALFKFFEEAVLREENGGVVKISPEIISEIISKCNKTKEGSSNFISTIFDSIVKQKRTTSVQCSQAMVDIVGHRDAFSTKSAIKLLKSADTDCALLFDGSSKKIQNLTAKGLGDVLYNLMSLRSLTNCAYGAPKEQIQAIQNEIIAANKEKRREYASYDVDSIIKIGRALAKANVLTHEVREQLLEAELLRSSGEKLGDATFDQLIDIGWTLAVSRSKNKELFTLVISALSEQYRSIESSIAQKGDKYLGKITTQLIQVQLYYRHELLGSSYEWGHEIATLIETWKQKRASSQSQSSATHENIFKVLSELLPQQAQPKMEVCLDGLDVDICYKLPDRKSKGVVIEVDGDTHFETKDKNFFESNTRLRNILLISMGYELFVIPVSSWKQISKPEHQQEYLCKLLGLDHQLSSKNGKK